MAAAVPVDLPAVPAAELIRAVLDEEVERWLEIRDGTGRLVTVLELLSPSNKLDAAERNRCERKRRTFLGGGVSVVEIDLVRQGARGFPRAVCTVLDRAGACYGVCVFRATRPGECEVYPIRLRDPQRLVRNGLGRFDPAERCGIGGCRVREGVQWRRARQGFGQSCVRAIPQGYRPFDAGLRKNAGALLNC